MSMRVWRALAALYVGTLLVTLSPSWAWAGQTDVDDFIRGQMAARHIPGLTVAVVQDGQVVLERGYGVANVEHDVSASPDTMYQLASVTKQFTATAVMMLVEDGRLTLGTPLKRVLPEVPAAWGDVTIAHLLGHTSGIPSYTSVPDFHRTMRKDYTPVELLDLVKDRAMDFAPGTRFRYNNTGYVLLGLVIEKLSGQPWGTFLESRIFAPVGMPTARVNDLSVVVPHRAQGYAWSNGLLRNGEYVSPTQPYAAGALLVSVKDLVRWDLALWTRPLLSPASLAAMSAPAPLADGTTHPYGFGWEVGTYRTRRRHAHGGGIPGFSTYYTRFIDDKVSVIVLANEGSGGAESIANGIAAFYIPALREHAPKPIPDSAPAQTAFHAKVMTTIATGTGEKDWFTPEQQAFFFPDRIREGAWRIGGHGTLKSFVLMEESSSDKGTMRSYLASFERIGVRCTFMLAPDGKIAGLNLRLE